MSTAVIPSMSPSRPRLVGPALRMLSAGRIPEATCRLEHADLPDGGRAHLAMVACCGKASALALVRDAGRASLTLASALFDADAAFAPIEALLPLMRREPLSEHAFSRFEANGSGGGGALNGKLLDLRRALGGDGGSLRGFQRLRAPPPPHAGLGLPYDGRNDRRPPAFPVEGAPIHVPDTGKANRGSTFRMSHDGSDTAVIGGWIAEVSRDFQPGHGLTLGPGAWSPEAVAYYAVEGAVGRWRRQDHRP